MAAGAKMLSAGLSRALAVAAKSQQDASTLLLHTPPPRSIRGVGRVSCSASFRTGSAECRVHPADAFAASKFADTPLQAAFYDGAQPEAVAQAAMRRPEFSVQEAEVGKVECNGRGCRPFLDDDDHDDHLPAAGAASASAARLDWNHDRPPTVDVLASRAALYHSRSAARDRAAARASAGAKTAASTRFPLDFAEYLDEVWMETAAADKYFCAALQADGRNPRLLLAYANFCWRSQADADKAERVYKQALELAPHDPDILASYAHFLWQADD